MLCPNGMTSAVQKLFSFLGCYLLLVGLSVCAIHILVREGLSCANELKTIPHCLFYQVHCTWPYLEVFEPLELIL